MPTEDDDIMGIEGLAKYLNLSKSTVYKLAQEGSLPSQKVGKHWRFRQETVNRWLDGELPGKPLSAELRPAEAKEPAVVTNAGDRLLSTYTERFSELHINLLKARWIETVDQFFSIAATPTGASGLASLLDLGDTEFSSWLAAFEKEILAALPSPAQDDGGAG